MYGPYCAQCGQKQQERLTLKVILRSAYESITNLERGFGHTVLTLLARPGKVAEDYLAGKRKAYFPPVRYLIIMIALSALVLIYSGYYDEQYEAMKQWQEQQLSVTGDQQKTEIYTEEQQQRQARIQEFTKNYLNLISLLSYPFLGLVSFWAFRKRKYNYAEHLVICAYWGAQSALYAMIVLLLLLLLPVPLLYSFSITLLISILYYSVGYRQLFKISFGRAVLKSLLTNIGGFLLFFFTFLILSVILTLVYLIIFK